MRARVAVAHGDEEVLAEEQRGLAVGDLVALAERRGARDDEQLGAVGLGLGRVALAQRVLDRERMQAVLGLDLLHFLGRRLDQPDPVELRLARAARNRRGRSASTSFPFR